MEHRALRMRIDALLFLFLELLLFLGFFLSDLLLLSYFGISFGALSKVVLNWFDPHLETANHGVQSRGLVSVERNCDQLVGLIEAGWSVISKIASVLLIFGCLAFRIIH